MECKLKQQNKTKRGLATGGVVGHTLVSKRWIGIHIWVTSKYCLLLSFCTLFCQWGMSHSVRVCLRKAKKIHSLSSIATCFEFVEDRLFSLVWNKCIFCKQFGNHCRSKLFAMKGRRLLSDKPVFEGYLARGASNTGSSDNNLLPFMANSL